MKLAIYEMLKNVAAVGPREGKRELLRKYVMENPVLSQILDYSFDPKVKFVLPEGSPPYKENEFPDTHGQLFMAAKRLYLFIEGGRPDLTDVRREQLFIGFLEELHPEDAKVIVRMKDKKSPWPGVTQRLVEETFGVNYDRNRPKLYKKEKTESDDGKDDQEGSEQRGRKASRPGKKKKARKEGSESSGGPEESPGA